jgi:glutathione peroxidase-family protein
MEVLALTHSGFASTNYSELTHLYEKYKTEGKLIFFKENIWFFWHFGTRAHPDCCGKNFCFSKLNNTFAMRLSFELVLIFLSI